MKPILGFAEPTALQTLKLVFERQPTAAFQKPIFIMEITDILHDGCENLKLL